MSVSNTNSSDNWRTLRTAPPTRARRRFRLLSLRGWQRCAAALSVAFTLVLQSGCAVPPPPPAGPTVEEIARQQRLERAKNALADGLKQYEAGSFDESMKSMLIALDSGVLALAQQINARKHIAFIQCINNREIVCKEEFEKAFALDPKFDLTPAESGHPTWGPIFRLVRTEIELRKLGKPLPSASVKVATQGEKLLSESMKSYDDADYTKAIRLFQETLREPNSPADKIKAHKYLAFSYCLTNKLTLCRAEFDKILQLDAAFELETAEAGHPSWGPPFRTVKAKQKQAAGKAPK